MRLYLLRNAKTIPGKKDARRELSSNGIQSLEKLAVFLNNKELIEVDEIRHSPLVRARQTASHFKTFTGIKAKTREVPLLDPFADFRILADILESSGENLLLVGHQPNLSMLASYLLTKESKPDLFKLKRAGLLCLEKADDSEPDDDWDASWQLRWMIDPQLLKKK